MRVPRRPSRAAAMHVAHVRDRASCRAASARRSRSRPPRASRASSVVASNLPLLHQRGDFLGRHVLDVLAPDGWGLAHPGRAGRGSRRAGARAGKFEATTDEARSREADAMSIAVPTPLGKTRDPDMSYVIAAAEDGRRGTRIRACSSSSRARRIPGTTREVHAAGARRSAASTSARTSSSPSAPSASIRATRSTTRRTRPRSSAASRRPAPSSRRRSTRAASTPSCRSRRTEAAELVKLLENTFRAVNIGLVNEMAIVCDKLGVDVWEVIDAAATKPFGFMKFTPGPGLGGHCIPLDPHYLAWKMRTLNYKTRFIDLAGEINSEMPAFVVEKVAQRAERRAQAGQRQPACSCSASPTSGTSTTCARVRRSTSCGCSKSAAPRWSFHDPYVADDPRGRARAPRRRRSPTQRSRRADAVVIVTDHTNVDYQLRHGQRRAGRRQPQRDGEDVSHAKARIVSLARRPRAESSRRRRRPADRDTR